MSKLGEASQSENVDKEVYWQIKWEKVETFCIKVAVQAFMFHLDENDGFTCSVDADGIPFMYADVKIIFNLQQQTNSGIVSSMNKNMLNSGSYVLLSRRGIFRHGQNCFG